MSPTRSISQLYKYRFAPTSTNTSAITSSTSTNRRFAEGEDSLEMLLSVNEHNTVAESEDINPGDVDKIVYPIEETERQTFRTKQGKAVTAHQWAVYDFVRQIPVGRVTTYKAICSALGSGSPRSVGTALRNNPFAPFIPCHRVIASTGYIGGFLGEWNNPASAPVNQGTGHVRRKIEILSRENVRFDDKGYLVGGEDMIWVGNLNI